MKTFELSYINNGKCFETKKGTDVKEFIHFFNEWVYDMDISCMIKHRRMKPAEYKKWSDNIYIKVVIDGKEIKKTNIKWWKDNFKFTEDGHIKEAKK